MPRQKAEMMPTPAARPSTPSIMLKALMKATIQKSVKGKPSQTGKWIPKQTSMRKPRSQATRAASVWKRNFVRALRPLWSSRTPSGRRMASGASNFSIFCDVASPPRQVRLKKIAEIVTKATSIPRPPPRGTVLVWI